MSTEELHTFVIWAPDYTDSEALGRRLKARQAHLDRWKVFVEQGFQKLGGPTLSPASIATADAQKVMNGSMMVVKAKTLEEVKVVVEDDPYWHGEVWDKEKLVISPIILPSL